MPDVRDLEAEVVRLQAVSDYHKRKADEWETAYQRERITSADAYTRRFVRRPRMRPIVRWLACL